MASASLGEVCMLGTRCWTGSDQWPLPLLVCRLLLSFLLSVDCLLFCLLFLLAQCRVRQT